MSNDVKSTDTMTLTNFLTSSAQSFICDLTLPCIVLSYVINRGLFFEHMNSLIGRNAVFCSLRYGICLNHICVTDFKPNYFRQLFYAQLNSDVIARADNAYEIILIREKALSLPNFLIERTDFASLLDVLLRPP